MGAVDDYLAATEIEVSGPRRWRVDSDMLGDFVPEGVKKEMLEPGQSFRACEFDVSGTRVKVSVVEPGADRRVSEGRARWWCGAVALAAKEVSGRFSTRKPVSISVTLFLSGERKRVRGMGGGVWIGAREVNTGMTRLYGTTGSAVILVYREEEALKTVVHELLHAYGFGVWANADEGMISACRALAAALGIELISPNGLRPCEALVDAVAIWMSVMVFGGASWPECVEHAADVCNLMLSMCAESGGVWRQRTPAFEYYCVKNAVMGVMSDPGRAPMGGGELASAIASAGGRAMRPARRGYYSVRMTPRGLARGPDRGRSKKECSMKKME